MNAEKRVLLASLLSVVCISLYSQTLIKKTRQPSEALPQQAAADAQLQVRPETSSFASPLADEETVSIESDSLIVSIGASTGTVRRVSLKRFLNESKSKPLSFGADLPLISVEEAGKPFSVRQVSKEAAKATLTVESASGRQYNLVYALAPDKPLLTVTLASQQPIKLNNHGLVFSWVRGDTLSSQQNRLELFSMDSENGKPKYKHFGGPWKTEKNVPRGTFLMALTERYFCVAATFDKRTVKTVLIPSPDNTIAARVVIPEQAADASLNLAQVYFGPRDYFQLKKAGFEQAFPIGTLGQIGLILLQILGFITKITRSHGLAIVFFSVFITVLTAPFTVLSVRSMKRMQQLKPQADQLMAQHKKDPQKANKEIFALYKKNKVSPIGGCLPMLLQMPIFIALFQAMSHYIELRGTSFWKIADLSLPDQLLKLPGPLPLVGSAINLLPVIMAGAMYFQTKASQQGMASADSNPTAQMMSGPLMPVLFLFMFYNFPSGLVIYWLTNSLLSILSYRLVK